MSRPRRISRPLIGLLVLVIVLGAAFYLNNVKRSSAGEASPPRSDPPGALVQVVPQPPAAQPAITVSGPATQPATRPARAVNMGSTGDSAGTATTNPILDAREKVAAGDLLTARRMLNDSLISGSLSAADADAARRMLGEINQVVFFSAKQFAGDPFGGTYTVKTGELLRSIADRHEIPWELLARLNGISDPRKLRAGQTIKVVHGPFHAVVSKSKYTLDIYLGGPGEIASLFVMSFPVGLGANDSTPVGTWMVETHKKIKNPTYFSPRGQGVIDAADPKNPLGERWIGLVGIDGGAVGQVSYGIHGTIEPQSIGKQSSMGCIRMRNEDVELVFDMLVEGKSTVMVRE